MTFKDLLTQVIDWLRQEQRVSYRALKAQFGLDDDVLAALKGELLLQEAPVHQEEAEENFQQALAVSRRQQAKSWELRAAMSLSRLWQHQGKGAEARALLAPIYGWFTEGFETADLLEARALLQVLEGGEAQQPV
jgi:predicted ATPase